MTPAAAPWLRIICLALMLGCATMWSASARADITDCLGGTGLESGKIEACTALIETPGLDSQLLAEAYAARALAYSLLSQYSQSISDYDRAIEINPNYAAALNNRAWAYFRKGEPLKGLPDSERSLALEPFSAASYDTRAHIRQWMGDRDAALSDYNRALRLGDKRLIKLYQCGLKYHGFYDGPLDGIRTEELFTAMRACLGAPKCDPLPTDEECPDATS